MTDQPDATLERFQKLAPTVAALPNCKCAGVDNGDGTKGIILCHPIELPIGATHATLRYVHLRKFGGVYYIYYVDHRPRNLFDDWFTSDFLSTQLFGQKQPVAICAEADLDKTLLDCWNKWCEKNPAPEDI